MKSIFRRLLSADSSPPFAAPVLRDDDVFLVSYPKSGNTWMRFLLANYISGDEVGISKVDALLPDIHYNPQDIDMAPKPRIIKSHAPFNPEYKRVVYIVRDVRDVAVSYYYHLKKFNEIAADISFGEYLNSFIAGGVGSCGAWGQHVDGWLNGAEDMLMIRYEDMLLDTEKSLADVLRFCGIECDKEKISQAVAACTLGKLRKVEHNEFDKIESLSTSNSNIDFFRKGVAGDWINYFNESDRKKLEAEFSITMGRLGFN